MTSDRWRFDKPLISSAGTQYKPYSHTAVWLLECPCLDSSACPWEPWGVSSENQSWCCWRDCPRAWPRCFRPPSLTGERPGPRTSCGWCRGDIRILGTGVQHEGRKATASTIPYHRQIVRSENTTTMTVCQKYQNTGGQKRCCRPGPVRLIVLKPPTGIASRR